MRRLDVPVESRKPGRCRFRQLEGLVNAARGEIVVACEFLDEDGETRLRVGSTGSDGNGEVDLGRLVGVWTVASEQRSGAPPPPASPSARA